MRGDHAAGFTADMMATGATVEQIEAAARRRYEYGLGPNATPWDGLMPETRRSVVERRTFEAGFIVDADHRIVPAADLAALLEHAVRDGADPALIGRVRALIGEAAE